SWCRSASPSPAARSGWPGPRGRRPGRSAATWSPPVDRRVPRRPRCVAPPGLDRRRGPACWRQSLLYLSARHSGVPARTPGAKLTRLPQTTPETLMKLSILMPVYNEEARLAEALKQVLAVNYPCDTELIVVDDGSQDGTREILDQIDDPHVTVILH